MYRQEKHQRTSAVPEVTLQRGVMVQRAAWGAACIALMLLIVSPSLAWGHTAPLLIAPSLQDPASQLSALVDVHSPESLPHHGTRPGLLLVALFLLSPLMFSGMTKRSRRAGALCFVLILSLYTFSLTIHSVHHLFDPHPATECLGFLASQHVSGTSAEAWQLDTPSATVEGPPAVSLDTFTPILFFRPNQQRAPPA
jgi:hypothetical protein